MKIFISGPMTGYERFNFDEFLKAESFLTSIGHDVVNPVNICRKYKMDDVLSDKSVFNKMIQEELDELVKCDIIFLLNGWEKSSGAKKELKLAIENNLEIVLQQRV